MTCRQKALLNWLWEIPLMIFLMPIVAIIWFCCEVSEEWESATASDKQTEKVKALGERTL